MSRVVWIVLAGSALTTPPQAGAQDAPRRQQDAPRRPRAASADAPADKGATVAPPRSAPQLLQMRVAEASFDAVPLEQVVDWLVERTGVNVLVRWSVLEAAGIERDKPISVRVRNVRLAQLLWLIMNEAVDQTGAKLAYRASGNVIVLSTHADLNRDMVVKVYEVRDLMHRVPYHANLQIGRTQTYVAGAQPIVAAGAVGFQPIIGEANSGVLLYTDDDDGERFRDAREVSDEELIRELIDAVVASIEPESWSVNGGPGSIVGWRGFLIVRNTPLVHQQLGGPLDERHAP